MSDCKLIRGPEISALGVACNARLTAHDSGRVILSLSAGVVDFCLHCSVEEADALADAIWSAASSAREMRMFPAVEPARETEAA